MNDTIGAAAYAHYLQSPAWQEKRRAVLNAPHTRRNAYQHACCLACGIELHDTNTHIHHLTYHRLYREQLTDLIALCEVCHTRVHELEQTLHTTVLHATTEMLREQGRLLPSRTSSRLPPRQPTLSKQTRRKGGIYYKRERITNGTLITPAQAKMMVPTLVKKKMNGHVDDETPHTHP